MQKPQETTENWVVKVHELPDHEYAVEIHYPSEDDVVVRKIVLPDSVTRIGHSAFRNCVNLEEITIPDSVERIDGSAFDGCSKLKKIRIPDGVAKISEFVFNECVSLEEIMIPDSVTEIGDYALWMSYDGYPQDSKLTSIVVPASVTAIGQGAFGCNLSLENVVLPPMITEIPDRCFYNCPRVRIAIPDGVKRIGEDAFNLGICANWYPDEPKEMQLPKEIRLPSGLETIENDAFGWREDLENINIPDSVTEIGYHAFYRCRKLPAEVRERILSINPEAF
jgi:hypothetical protein